MVKKWQFWVVVTVVFLGQFLVVISVVKKGEFFFISVLKKSQVWWLLVW